MKRAAGLRSSLLLILLLTTLAVWAELAAWEPLAGLHRGLAAWWADLAGLGRRWEEFIFRGEEELARSAESERRAVLELLLEESGQENAELRRELGLRLRSPWRLVTVPLLPGGELTLDAGSAAGLRPGQGVLRGGWLTGIVGRVSGDGAELIALADPRLELGVRLDRTRQAGVLRGGEGGLRVVYLSAEALPAVGELVLTSGLGALPPGIPVGRVQTVEWSPGAVELECRVLPAVRPESAEFVEVVLGGEP